MDIIMELLPLFEEAIEFFEIVFFIIAVINMILFILNAIGIFKMSKSLELKNNWMAFVPFFSVFAFGRVAQHYVKKDGTKSAKFSVSLLILYILQNVLSVAFIAVTIYAMTDIYSSAEYVLSEGTSMTMEMFSSVIILIVVYFALLGVALAYTITYYVALWRIFAIFNDSNATLFTVLSVFFKFLPAIFILAISNKEPKVTYGQRLGLNLEEAYNE